MMASRSKPICWEPTDALRARSPERLLAELGRYMVAAEKDAERDYRDVLGLAPYFDCAERLLLPLVIVLAACSSAPGPTPTLTLGPPLAAPTQTTSTPPASPAASSVASSPSPLVSWGPLAVIPPQDGADTLYFEGTLRITDGCVVLESPSETALLVWPADRTTWIAASQSITFENYDGSVVTVRDGERVALGGSGHSAENEAESRISGQNLVWRMVWVVPPASSCSLDSLWTVGAVSSPRG